MKTYGVMWNEARTYQHPNPTRTAYVGRSDGEEVRTYKVWPSREAMLRSYYAHSKTCGITPHVCIVPVVK